MASDFRRAKKPEDTIDENGRVIQYLNPARALVETQTIQNSTEVVEIDFGFPSGNRIVLTVQGAAILARNLRKAVKAYLNPKDTEETG